MGHLAHNSEAYRSSSGMRENYLVFKWMFQSASVYEAVQRGVSSL